MAVAWHSAAYWRFLGIALLFAASGCNRGTHPDLVGKAAPVFTVEDSDRRVALHDLRGKTIVLNFWATWCPPCVQEMPSLMSLQSQLANHLSVLAVSVDEDPEAYHQFLIEHKINLLTVRDARQTANALYGTSMYPESFVIDPKGIVRRKFIGAVDWTSPEILHYLQGLRASGATSATN